MDTRLELCLLSCLLCLVCEMAAQAPQEVKKTNDCVDQKTCGACLAAGPPCGWCYQENYNHPERCDVVKNLVPNGCDDHYIVNPVSGSNFTVDMPPRNAEAMKEAIQLSPQEVKIKLRPNEPYKFRVSFRQAENYPVDLYYVMDLSNSMADDKVKLAELGGKLASRMSNITENFRLGFGSFVDKKTMPYVSTVPEKLNSPCDGCAAPYGFLNKLNLTEDTSLFQQRVLDAPISGNLDSPEGGFDAIMQAIACQIIGWRNQSRKMLLFSTDAGFHYAGDGKLGGIVTPNDGRCHLSMEGEYTESLYQDYPSISQLAHRIAETKVNVIFAVTENQINVYRNLSAFIEGSTVGELANDSSNIVELVKDNYDKISSSIELKTQDAEDVIVKFKTKCLGNEERDVAKCEKIGIAQNVTFEVSVMVTSCPTDRSQWNKAFKIYPVGLTESLLVNLELQCECNCEKPELEEPNSPKCNSSGTYECGACSCNPGRYGRHCECDGSTLGSADYDAQCKMTNTSKVCEGRGQCLCGKCDCQAISSSNTSRRYSGPFCECNNFNCDYSHDDLCGGPSRGTCKCGKCECVKDVWQGAACECPVSQATCLAKKDGSVCNNKGECKCGVCDCNKDVTYKGPTCEECPTCPGECEQKKPCVQCKAYQNYKTISKEDCEANCTHVEVVLELGHNEDPDNWKLCKFRDDDDCDAIFEYHFNSNSVKAQATKECPEPVNILAIVLGVIGGIILIGLLLLLIWKLLVTIHDRREYARFEKERENARWDMGENPIYKQATSTYKNPTYATKD